MYRAKNAYKNKNGASEYDRVRFRSLKGKILDYFEKASIKKALKGVSKQSHILDIPCGTGRITEALLNWNFSVTGADISEAMIKETRKKLDNRPRLNELIKTDAESMIFENNQFDIITCVRLMGHVPPEYRVKILSEMRRVTNRYVIITFYLSTPIQNLKRKIKQMIKPNPALWFPVTKNELISEVSAAGLMFVRGFHVLSGISEGLTCLLEKRSNPNITNYE